MVNYTTINHEARLKLKLSWLEYGLADLIYHLANNPGSDYPTWCYASKEKLAELLGTTKQTVHNLLNKLIEAKLVERHPETKHLRVTIDWYHEVLTKVDSKETLLPVKKLDSHSKESLLRDSKESLHNKDIYNKDTNKLPSNEGNGGVKPTSHGNIRVNLVLEEFKKRWGYPPTDRSPRNEAWLLVRQLEAWLKGRGKEPNEEMFTKAVKFLFDRIEDQDWAERVQTLNVIRRKSVIYLPAKKEANVPATNQ